MMTYGGNELSEKEQQKHSFDKAMRKLDGKAGSIKMLINDAKVSSDQRKKLKNYINQILKDL